MTRRLTGSIANPNEEFWYHVAQQHELPLVYEPEKPTLSALDRLADALKEKATTDVTADLAEEILTNPELVYTLRTIISISDKRLYLDFSYLFSRLPHPTRGEETMCGCQPEQLTRHQLKFFINILKKWSDVPKSKAALAKYTDDRALSESAAQTIAEYFLKKGLAEMLAFYARLGAEDRRILVEYLIIPGELQQAEAKLRGHGIERLLAQKLRQFDITFSPSIKDENPMGSHDPNIDPDTMTIVDRDPTGTFSTDLVVHDAKGNPVSFVVGLIHTSDPGQFGVDKSNTVVEINKQMSIFNAKGGHSVELWGLVDGVGYSENKAGTIEKMIPAFGCVIQFHSIYKAILRAHQLGLTVVKGITFDPTYYTTTAEKFMRDRYVPVGVNVVHWGSSVPEDWQGIEVGKAIIYR